MDKTCPEHKEYHTGCIPCQHDCIEENEELKVKIKQMEDEIKKIMADNNQYECESCCRKYNIAQKALEGK